jgi:hypothetical protein
VVVIVVGVDVVGVSVCVSSLALVVFRVFRKINDIWCWSRRKMELEVRKGAMGWWPLLGCVFV